MDINGGRLSFDALIKDSDFKKQIAAMEQRIVGLTQTSERESQKMDKIFTNLGGALAAFLTISQAQNFVSQLIRVRSEFQQLEIAFTTMLGSKEKADQLTKELIEFASTTPFGMKDTANAAKQLLAYGSSAESVRQELTMLGDVASGVSQPIGELVYLYGTLRMQGRAYQQDINQFAGRGIPIYKELANVLKINENEVRSFVEAGKVGFAEVQQAFQNMTAEGSMFGGLMEAQSKTIAGDLERLGDAFEQALNEIGQSSEGLINTSIQGLSLMVENYQKIIDILTILVVTYGSYKAAVIATTAIQAVATTTTQGWTVATMLQYRALVIAEGAQKLLNRTMLANPYVLAATALGALTVALFKFSDHLTTAEKAQKRLGDITEEANKSIIAQKIEVEDLIKVAKDETKSKNERYEAIKKLNNISPDYLGALDLETIGTQKATDAVNLYIEALKEKAFEQAAFNERVRIQQEKFEVERSGGTNWIQRAGMSLYGLTGGDKSAMEAAAKKAAMDALDIQEKALDEELNKRNQTKTKVEDAQNFVTNYEQLKKINQEIIAQEAELKKALAPDAVYDKAKIKSIKDNISNLKEQRDLLMGVSKDSQKASSELKKYQEEHASLLQKIYDKAEEVRSRGLTDNERELAQTRKFYSDLRKELEEFNKESKGPKISQSIFDRLNQLEEQDTGYLLSNQAVERDIQNIEKLDDIVDRITTLRSKINMLISKDASVGLTDEESNALKKYQDTLGVDLEKQQEKVKELTKTHHERLLEIEKNYQLQVQLAGENASEGKLLLLREARDNEIKLANETEAEKRAIITKGVQYQLTFTLGALKVQRDAILELLGSDDLTDKLKEKLEQELANLDAAIMSGAKAASKANSQARINDLKKELKKLEELGLETTDKYKELYEELIKISADSQQKLQDDTRDLINLILSFSYELNQIADSLTNLGDAFGNSGISNIGSVLGGIASNAQNLSVVFDEGASNTDKYAAAISSLVSMISMVADAAAERKRAEEEYYRSIIQLQHDYNLSLNEQRRLQSELAESPFVRDHIGRVKDAMVSSNEAMQEYQKGVEKLIKSGQVKSGQRDSVDWKNVGKGAAQGAAIGGAIGSVIPVIGTAIGAAIGAVGGFLVGLFGGKKKKDTFIGILEEYPELITQSENGLLRVNKELAEQLLKNNMLNEETKQILENILEWEKAIEEARKQIQEVVTELAGQMGDDLRNSLVSAFMAGEDAALAMGSTVGKVLENILSNLLFTAAFEEVFKTFENDLVNAFMSGNMNDFVGVMGDFLDAAGPAAEAFARGLEIAREQAAQRGISIFESTEPIDKNKEKFTGRINPGMTEQQANQAYAIDLRKIDLMSVIISEIQGVKYQNEGNIQSNQLLLMQGQMDALNSIRDNTGATVVKLEEISQKTDVAILELKGIKQNTTSKVGRNSYNGG